MLTSGMATSVLKQHYVVTDSLSWVCTTCLCLVLFFLKALLYANMTASSPKLISTTLAALVEIHMKITEKILISPARIICPPCLPITMSRGYCATLAPPRPLSFSLTVYNVETPCLTSPAGKGLVPSAKGCWLTKATYAPCCLLLTYQH